MPIADAFFAAATRHADMLAATMMLIFAIIDDAADFAITPCRHAADDAFVTLPPFLYFGDAADIIIFADTI